MLVALNADITGISIIMTSQTIIQISRRLSFMQSAILGIGPIGIGMISGHDHLPLVALNAECTFLVTGQAIIFIHPRVDTMIIFVIQRMSQAVQIISLMTVQTERILMTVAAGLHIQFRYGTMVFIPAGKMVRRFG
jgi:hypothetical protein